MTASFSKQVDKSNQVITKNIYPTREPTVRETLAKHEASALASSLLVSNLEHLKRANPALGRFVSEDIFGHLSSNSILGYREWAMLALVVLIAIGDTTDQIDVYLRASLHHGATENEILDLITHSAIYVGAPRAVNALRRVTQHFTLVRGYEIPAYGENIVWLGDHNTLVRDSHGNGPPMVLIHALGMDGRMWQSVFPQLADSGRVISYDMRGHGHSRGSPLTHSLTHLADDLCKLLDTLGVKQADVHGQSYGGAVAQYFALKYPHRVRSMGLITTAGVANPTWLGRATRAEANGMNSLIPESIIRWFTPESIAFNTWAVRYARMCVERARVEDWAAAWRAMSGLDCLGLLKEFDGPVLVVAGRQDLSTGPDIMKKIVDACSNAEYKELDPGTHMMALEQPDALAKEILAFRKKIDQNYST